MSISCIAYRLIIYSPTVFLSVPIPSIIHSTASPVSRNFGGTNPMPTPAGVPVAMIVPAFKVMPFVSSQITSSIPWIKSPVLEFWRSSPFTYDWIFNTGGNAVESTVMIHGPSGVNPSRLFPKYHCLCSVCTSLALTSFMIV